MSIEKKRLVDEIKGLVNRYEEEINKRKNNINSNYLLAKLDFLAIENYTDSVETFNKIIDEITDLQDRIIKRNRNN